MKTLEQVFKKKNNFIPIWFMRQAGRYMSEYMAIRKSESDFLNLCYNTEKVIEITLQPIDRFNFDAAIIFSDILIIPHLLNWDVQFKKNHGPILSQFSSKDHLLYLDNQLNDKINNIFDAISGVRSKLSQEKSLIGFAGGIWTVMSYMLEGIRSKDFEASKSFIYKNYDIAIKLRDLLTHHTILYLEGQIKAGVDVIQIFDSWSGVLSEDEYDDFVINPTQKIVTSLKTKYPEINIIGFPRCSGYLYDKYISSTKVDGISCDQFVPLDVIRKWQDKVVVQGNFDPILLLSDDKKLIARKADKILSSLDNKNFIFNLGHGILPSTDPKNVEFLINHIRKNG